ncbi:MAG: 30S ribosomal protein S12 methylthiotransferase RimO [Actinomycetota bacterium]|nr:30S ribosomal protein S12 methylthiotransferase RimO [Actinomycetota bacterium]
MAASRTVALVTLGCARNEVDSEELAGRLELQGWTLVDDAADADVAVVNTCGFVEQAKKDSIDTLLEASALKESGRTKAVVAVGCLAERYGEQLAAELLEADAVLGFDSYGDLSSHLEAILHGERPASHVPQDRRTLLPLSPVDRQGSAVAAPGHGDPSQPGLGQPDLPEGLAPASGPRVVRRRLDGRPWAPLKIASGCDRRCSFCAIPSFRGAFVSRRPADVLAEARWLAAEGVQELLLVSENSTSYGKDLGDLRLLEALLPELAAVEDVTRVRVSYLQPAEVRPGLLDVMCATAGVAAYFDLSFQHASGPLLRRMRRFGDRESFLGLLDQIRSRAPLAGVRSNVIVGFPGETDDDVEELVEFLSAARLDAVGVFGYSDEDGTEAEGYAGKLPAEEITARLARIGDLVEELTSQRAEERVGESVDVLIEHAPRAAGAEGRAEHQGPDVDGSTRLLADDGPPVVVGDIVRAVVVASEGVDLVARREEPR